MEVLRRAMMDYTDNEATTGSWLKGPGRFAVRTTTATLLFLLRITPPRIITAAASHVNTRKKTRLSGHWRWRLQAIRFTAWYSSFVTIFQAA